MPNEAVDFPYHYFWYDEKTGDWIYMDSVHEILEPKRTDIDWLGW